MNIKRAIFFSSALFLISLAKVSAQDSPVDEKKIQEIVTVEAEMAALPPNEDGSIPEDTSGPKEMASSEILKRAINFMKIESKKYTKGNAITTGSKAECVITFKYKPKELNPKADVQGSITMHVSIEAKTGKYRYTISKLQHHAIKGDLSGGDAYNEVPTCGSLNMPLDLWKRIRGEAIQKTSVVIDDLKEAMKVSSATPVNADEW
jgi:hypothetical protein